MKTGNVYQKVTATLLAAVAVGMFAAGCGDNGSGNPASPGNGGDLQPRWSGDDGIGAFLQARCGGCHGGNGGYYVSSYSETVTRVVPGNPDGSLLVKRLEGTVTPRMPANGDYLTDVEISAIRQWITDGATDL